MPEANRRILGIDPGTVSTGFGLVEGSGAYTAYLSSGTIRTEPGDAIAGRLKKIYDGLLNTIAEFHPSAVAIEGTFIDKNSQSALKLGQARGVAILVAAQSGLPVFEYAPAQVKMAVVGYGAATKVQIRIMVTRLLKMPREPESEHAADALAVALCHLHTARFDEVAKNGEYVPTRLPARQVRRITGRRT